MKQFFLAALFLSAPLMGADEFQTIFNCRTPYIADGGYVISIETGGIAGITQLNLGENTFAGHRHLATFVVTGKRQGVDTIFQGKDVQMVVKEGNVPPVGVPQTVYDANFSAVVNGHTHSDDVRCTSPLDPQ